MIPFCGENQINLEIHCRQWRKEISFTSVCHTELDLSSVVKHYDIKKAGAVIISVCMLIDKILQVYLKVQVGGLITQLCVSAATKGSVLPPAPFIPMAALVWLSELDTGVGLGTD